MQIKRINFKLLTLNSLYFLSAMAYAVTAYGQYPGSMLVTDLNGDNGFSLFGVNQIDWLGYAVADAGDINNDGMDDFMVSALFDDESNDNAGAVYIIYGDAGGRPAVFDLATLDGSNGFKLVGDGEEDHTGSSLNNAGDINHDGKNDIVITASSYASPGLVYNGATYVVFGADTFPASINLSDLNGSDGFVVYGRFSGDQASSADAAGDFNGDGVDDLLLGHQAHDPGMSNAGAIYVIYGQSGAFSSEFDLDNINGVNGVVFYGESAGDIAGTEVRNAGDFNGDGIDDILISAIRRNTNGDDSGTVYLVFGHASNWSAVNQLGDLNGSNGVIINGDGVDNFLGLGIDGAGDFNQDGFDDIVMSAQILSESHMESYVILGRSGPLVAEQDVSLWADLTVITGTVGALSSPYEYSIALAGDVNGDGLDDMVIGDYSDSTNNPYAGAAYVVFGSRTIANPLITSSELTGKLGFAVYGDFWDDNIGASVSSAGDVNHDGINDFIIGAYFVDINGTNSGAAYVVYGNDGIFKGTFE